MKRIHSTAPWLTARWSTAQSSTAQWSGGLWSAAAATVVILVILAVLAKPAEGHTGLFSASPAPGSVVGGEFTEYHLVFNEIVSDAVVWIEDLDANRIDVTMRNDSGSVIEFETDPLTEDGTYVVRYTLTSADGDPVRSGYAFSYLSSEPPPLPASVPIGPPEDSPDWLYRFAVGGAILSVIALAGLFLWRYQQLRALREAAEH